MLLTRGTRLVNVCGRQKYEGDNEAAMGILMTSAADMRQHRVEQTLEDMTEKRRHTPSVGEGVRGKVSSCSKIIPRDVNKATVTVISPTLNLFPPRRGATCVT